jgi:outer membrane protein TolC
MKRILLNTIFTLMTAAIAFAGNKVTLTLQQAVELANDSSLTAFKNQNLYASGYWEWRTYKANRLPSISLSLMPAQYYRYITQRYDSQQDLDIYRTQQIYTASGGLTATQNVDFLGGSLYLESDLDYMRTFGTDKSNQFSSIPVRVGYKQDLIGYNQFKWDKRIEPIKYEKVKREYIYNMETVSEEVVTYFFELALAQAQYKLAKENFASCDTLYQLGERRYKIAAISQADLLTLQLDKVNASNTLENAQISVKRATFALASSLGMDKNTEIDAMLPAKPTVVDIPVDVALNNAKENNPTLMGHKQTILEAQRDVNKTRAQYHFNASVNASIGFNQVANKFADAYRNLLQQDLVSVSISIPLVDWGVRKGNYHIAQNTLNVAQIAARQDELSVEQDVIMTINDFNTQQRLVASAVEALDLADMAYSQTCKRFAIGKADINSLTLSRNRQQDASTNYITALQNYWLSYYKIRKLTLFDFEMNCPISVSFDRALGVH